MHKANLVIGGFRNVYNKMVWLNGIAMNHRFGDYTSSEVHCIDYIGSHPDPNVTQLADAFYMTRGAISKMAKKLIAKGAIASYQKPDNKKEIYFRLTAAGQALFDTHEELHRGFTERDRAVFEQMTDAQFDDMLRFIDLYGRHLDTEIAKVNKDAKAL